MKQQKDLETLCDSLNRWQKYLITKVAKYCNLQARTVENLSRKKPRNYHLAFSLNKYQKTGYVLNKSSQQHSKHAPTR